MHAGTYLIYKYFSLIFKNYYIQNGLKNNKVSFHKQQFFKFILIFINEGKCVVPLKASNTKWNQLNWKKFSQHPHQQFQCTWK